MAYIPPHKRLKDPTKPALVPESFGTKFKKKLDLKSVIRKDIVYSEHSVSKCFLVDSNGIEVEVPPYVTLVPVSSDSKDFRKGEKPLRLKNNNVQNESDKEKTQWLLLAEKVEDDIFLAYERAKTNMKEHHVLRLVARFGRIFFYGCQDGPVGEGLLKPLKYNFSSDVSTSFLEQIKSKVVPSHGFCLDVEKETYIVKVSHYTQPNVTINLKCTINYGRLSMYKIELNPTRHLVVDLSCTDKNLDMRLMMSAKRKMTTLSEEELGNIRAVIDSATVDPNVKGRLWWPDGKASTKDGYKVFGYCNIRTTIFQSQPLRLRIKERSDERSKVMREVSLTLKDITTKLQEQNLERGCVVEMLRDALGILWDFLNCDTPDDS